MEPKWGAKNRMYYILTHNKLSFFRLLKFPPDLSYGPVMTVCCLAKWKLDFLSLLLVLSGSDQRFKRNGGKVFYRLIDGRLDMQKKKKNTQWSYDARVYVNGLLQLHLAASKLSWFRSGWPREPASKLLHLIWNGKMFKDWEEKHLIIRKRRKK